MSHECPINGCGTVVSDEKLMCYRHWSIVPVHLQRDVTQQWRASNRMNAASRDRLIAINNYRTARDAAVKHVNDALRPLVSG